MALINVCSLKKLCSTNKKACSLLYNDLQNFNIEVCVVTETFLRPSVPDSFITIDGFRLHRRDREACSCRNKSCLRMHKGGGVLIYVHERFISDTFDASTNCESFWIKLSPAPYTGEDAIFINASYHPPNSDCAALLDYLRSTVRSIDENYPRSPLFICGDFNRIDLEELESECGLFILDSPPTRDAARLDLVLTNLPEVINDISSFKSQVETDHLGLLIKPKRKTKPNRTKRCFRLFSFYGHRQLNHLLSHVDFKDFYSIDDIHEAAEWLEKTIFSCFDRAFPVKQVLISDKDPHWITPKVKWLINQKKQAKRRNNETKMQLFDKKIKTQKLHRLLQLRMSGTRVCWTEVDKITHRKQTSNKIASHAFEPHRLNYELSLRSAIRENTSRQPSPHYSLIGCSAPQLSLYDVMQVIKSCKRTSEGPSNIPYFIYREYWDILVPPFHHLWNRSLEAGIFPNCYKVANLLPLPKVKNAKHADDIRGISITPISARLFEKAVHRRWIAPKITSLGDPHQFAYKQGVSTIDCLLCIQHFILLNLDRAEVDAVHAILIDYSKAFDRVNQEKAAEQYSQFIESPHLRKWLYNFSTGRKQRLIWNDSPLSYQLIDRGCSQGTVGGPALFSMFTDDCKAAHQTSCIFKYSDDMNCLSLCLKQPSEKQKGILNKEVVNLLKYAIDKELDINIKKSKLMRFCLNRCPNCQCKQVDAQFDSIEEARILGITFQADCSFRKHCRRLVSELRRQLYIFKDLKLSNIPLRDIYTIFDSLIVSRIRYGLSIYGSDTKSIRRIDRFLERCFEKNLCPSPIRVLQLRQQEDQRQMNKILLNPRHPMYDYLTSFSKSRTTRHGFASVRPYVRTTAFHNAFSNRVLSFSE